MSERSPSALQRFSQNQLSSQSQTIQDVQAYLPSPDTQLKGTKDRIETFGSSQKFAYKGKLKDIDQVEEFSPRRPDSVSSNK